ncbi:MAG: hypothetical protein QM487_11065 [Candidatus Marithrix sp.]
MILILDNGSTVLSERGTADLLGMNHKALQNVATTGIPKRLKPFINNDFSVATTLVEVTAKNSPHKGRTIVVYDSKFIESLMRAYVMAIGHNVLQKNQMHIGRRCAILQSALVYSALKTAIKQACGLTPNIQKIAQKSYTDVVKLLKNFNFICSIEGDIATKKDIAKFTELPISTINYYLKTHNDAINAI